MKKRAVVLLSGGLDSTVTLCHAIRDGYEVTALSFDYGQRAKIEIEAAVKVAKHLGVRIHHVLQVPLEGFQGSSLTSNRPVRKDVPLIEIGKEIPDTYVPARNIIFLSIAVSLAESCNAEAVFIGVNVLDFSGYPDCRPAFIRAFQETIRVGTREGTVHKPVEIKTPLISMDKEDIIKHGISLSAPLEITHTCYAPSTDELSCGRCEACLLRLDGFRRAVVPDPINYAPRPV
jgi:7-cyano-7-deazaguanine synthase